MCNTIVGAGAASRYGSGSDQKMRLLAAPAPQHWKIQISVEMPVTQQYRTDVCFKRKVEAKALFFI
jgi:hypothetical protein